MFTVIFSGNIEDFVGNPHLVDTAFGRPVIIDRRNLAEECERLHIEIEERAGNGGEPVR